MKIAVIFSNGTEEIEGITMVDVARRAKLECDLISIDEKIVNCSRGVKVLADKLIGEVDLDDYNAIVIPGGMPGASNISNNQKVIFGLRNAIISNKVVGAICAAPAVVLARHNLIDNKRATCYPFKDFIDIMSATEYTGKSVEEDGNLITANGPESALEFAIKVCEKLGFTPKF